VLLASYPRNIPAPRPLTGSPPSPGEVLRLLQGAAGVFHSVQHRLKNIEKAKKEAKQTALDEELASL